MTDWLARRALRMGWKWPVIWRLSRARLVALSRDGRKAEVLVRPTWLTRDRHGEIAGSVLQVAVEPVIMAMVERQVSSEYVVWVYVSSVEISRPLRTDLRARIELRETALEHLGECLDVQGFAQLDVTATWCDRRGTEHAQTTVGLRVRRRTLQTPLKLEPTMLPELG